MPGSMLRTKEAAEYVGIPLRTFEAHYLIWQVPHFKVGRALVFRESELDEWLETRRVM